MDIRGKRLILKFEKEDDRLGAYPKYVSDDDEGRGPSVTGVYIQRRCLPNPLPERLVITIEDE